MVMSNIWVSLTVCAAAVLQNVNATPEPLIGGTRRLNQQGEQKSLKIVKERIVVLTNVG